MISRKLAMLGVIASAGAMAATAPTVRARVIAPRRVTARESANINRHTGEPHEHKREVARRQRQAERRAAR